MSLWDLGIGYAIGQASNKEQGEGCAISMIPIAAEFLGVTIVGAQLVTAFVHRSTNPFIALALIAVGGIGAFLLYRALHLWALRILPLKIAVIALSGCIWGGAIWFLLPGTRPVLPILVFVAASAIKAVTMKRLS